MAVIKSGNSTDQMTVDPTAKAARVTLYASNGAERGDSTTPLFSKISSSVNGEDQLIIDPASNAARVTLYNADGTPNLGVSTIPTYSTSATAWSIPNSPTDLFTLYGSSSKTIKVYELVVSANQNTAGINTFFLLKRSTANSGGTLTNPTIVKHDTNDATPSATPSTYTANATSLGTSLGALAHVRLLCAAPAGVNAASWKYTAGDSNGAPIVLRGAGQGIALSFNGASLPAGLSLSVYVRWTEE